MGRARGFHAVLGSRAVTELGNQQLGAGTREEPVARKNSWGCSLPTPLSCGPITKAVLSLLVCGLSTPILRVSLIRDCNFN